MTIHKLKHITYDLVKMEKVLVFQILEQDESWICKYKNPVEKTLFSFKSSNKIEVLSRYSPHINNIDHIFGREIDLRGSYTKLNLEILTKIFITNTQRDKYYNKIIQALKEWNLMVEGLKEKE